MYKELEFNRKCQKDLESQELVAKEHVGKNCQFKQKQLCEKKLNFKLLKPKVYFIEALNVTIQGWNITKLNKTSIRIHFSNLLRKETCQKIVRKRLMFST